MREATGELNMTVIVFAAVALLTALFFFIVWPRLKEGLRTDESCATAVCDHGYIENEDFDGVDVTGMTWCYNPNNPDEVFVCPYRG